ncbi:glutathione-dependent formaldehyde-activating enzyme-like protein [Hyaloraphidium curvatum]|nr:glutathione-dependent formaldehyde-activating enzyme-like protein [Hyaloraphidium curvatum]
MPSMDVDGSCLCGRITYRARIDPTRVQLCHCTQCQASGDTYRAVVPVPTPDFTLLTGTTKIYVKTSESGSRRALHFCPECGCQIYGAAAEGPSAVYSLRIGTVAQRALLPAPTRQIWCRSALPWSLVAGVTRHERQPEDVLGAPKA